MDVLRLILLAIACLIEGEGGVWVFEEDDPDDSIDEYPTQERTGPSRNRGVSILRGRRRAPVCVSLGSDSRCSRPTHQQAQDATLEVTGQY